MRCDITLDGNPLDYSELEITHQLSNYRKSARFTYRVPRGQAFAKAHQTVFITETGNASNVVFGGRVSNANVVLDVGERMEVQCDCLDWRQITDATYITEGEFPMMTDREHIQRWLANTPLIAADENMDAIVSKSQAYIQNVQLTKLLDKTALEADAEWIILPDQNFVYRARSTAPLATFYLSDAVVSQ